MTTVALQSFGFGDQLVRTMERDGSVWFVANDVCASLEIANPRDAIRHLADDERDDVGITDAIGREQRTTIISESGVYCLIFKSRKPIAVTFRKWVTAEVLPALRQHGRYDIAAEEEEDDDATMPVPHMGSQADRDNFRTAVAVVRMYERNWGPAAARAMAARLGFPQYEVDLLPVAVPPPSARGAAAIPPLQGEQAEGDVVLWGRAVSLVPSKYDATHKSELYTSYTKWCSAYRFRVMHPDRWEKIMLTMYGVEEHPEMFRCVMRNG